MSSGDNYPVSLRLDLTCFISISLPAEMQRLAAWPRQQPAARPDLCANYLAGTDFHQHAQLTCWVRLQPGKVWVIVLCYCVTTKIPSEPESRPSVKSHVCSSQHGANPSLSSGDKRNFMWASTQHCLLLPRSGDTLIGPGTLDFTSVST